MIDLNVGGIHYLTSISTLTSFPESYFGVMFSGGHDLKAMQCKDGSYFIDRDGTHFRCILNYLRNGEEVVESFSRLSADVVSDLLCEAKFYQLDGLVKVLLREIDVITQDNLMYHFNKRINNSYYSYCSIEEIVFENKNMARLSFVGIEFKEAVSFINCNLSNSVFHHSIFCSDVIFKNCLLGNTMFIDVVIVDVHKNVSFIDSNVERALFSSGVKRCSASAELCALYCLHERGIVMCSASAELCALYYLHKRGIVMCSASTELCVLCGLRKHGIVCFVMSPRAWNCNVLRKRGIVCFVLSPRAWNCNVLRKRGIVCFVLSPRAWNCDVLCKHGIVHFMWFLQAQSRMLCTVSTSVEL